MTVQDIKRLQANIAGLTSIVDELRKKQFYATERLNKFSKGLTYAQRALPINQAKLKELSKVVQSFGRDLRANEATLRNQNKALSEATREHEKNANAVKNNASANQGFLAVLVKMEMSFRRIQGGLNRIVKAATFVDSTAAATNNFINMAQAIGASAAEMKKLQFATMKFGAGSDEATGIYRELMTDMANLRMGQGGGRLEKLIKVWGLNVTGYESATELMSKIQQKYLSLDGFRRIAFQQDAGFSDALATMFRSLSPDDFVKKIEEEKATGLESGEVDETKKKAESVVASEAEQRQKKELADVAAMNKLSGVSESTHELIAKIYDYMVKYPWITGVKAATEAGGAVASTAISAASMITMMKHMKALKTAKDAASVGSALAGGATAVGGMGALPILGIIAASVGVVAGGWWAVTKISDMVEEDVRGKKKGQTTEEAIAEKQNVLDERRAEHARAKEYGSATDIEKAEKRLQEAEADLQKTIERTAESDRLSASVNSTLDKISKGEWVSELEYADLSKGLKLSELKDKIREKLGVDSDSDWFTGYRFTVSKRARELQLFNRMASGNYGSGLTFVGQYEKSKKGKLTDGNIDLLKEYARSDEAANATPEERKIVGRYIETHMDGDLLRDFWAFNKSNPQYKGMAAQWVVDAARKGIGRWMKENEAQRYSDEERVPMERYLRGIDNKREEEGKTILYQQPSNVFEEEKLRKEKERLISGSYINLFGLAGSMNNYLSKVSEASELADEANIPSTAVDGTSASTTLNEGERTFNLETKNQIVINANVGSASDVGTAVQQARTGASAFITDITDKFEAKFTEAILAAVPSVRSSQVV